MRLVLMHLHDEPLRRDPREEVSIIVPGSAKKVVFAVPLGALERFLPTLVEESTGLEQACESCGEPLAAMPPRWLGQR